jgi:hypothetical protein
MKVFCCLNGAANGMNSLNWSCRERNRSYQLSLQLKGTGTKYSDFTWQTIYSKYVWAGGQSFSDCKIPMVAPTNVGKILP